MQCNGFSLTVLVDERPLPETVEGGCGWIAAERGKAFSLLIANGSGRQVLAVPSVDGLSVMTGDPASYGSGGYIIGAYSHVTVPGWRLDDASVARFEFGTSAEGYARQMNRSQHNVGVIAAAFFKEEITLFAVSDVPTDNVAVKFGAKVEHRVREITFERKSQPEAVIEIRYDTHRGIQSRGIGCPTPPRWSVPQTAKVIAPFSRKEVAPAANTEANDDRRFWLTLAIVVGTIIVLVTALSR